VQGLKPKNGVNAGNNDTFKTKKKKERMVATLGVEGGIVKNRR